MTDPPQTVKRPFFPLNRQGIVIDVLTAITNLFVLPLFMTRVGSLFDESFRDNSSAFLTLAGLMLFILAGRLLGLYLKRFSLQARLANSSDGSFPMVFFVFSVPLLVLTAAFVVVLFQSITAQVGLVEATSGGMPRDSQWFAYFGVLVMTVLMGLEVYLLFRLSRPLTEREKELRDRGVWMYTPAGEYFADFGLFAYMMIWQVFYYQTAEVLLTMPNGEPVAGDMKVISVIFLAVAFVLFYLAPRAVFLIEDRKYRGTWLSIGLVFILSIVRHW
jgi:hypothetical protein